MQIGITDTIGAKPLTDAGEKTATVSDPPFAGLLAKFVSGKALLSSVAPPEVQRVQTGPDGADAPVYDIAGLFGLQTQPGTSAQLSAELSNGSKTVGATDLTTGKAMTGQATANAAQTTTPTSADVVNEGQIPLAGEGVDADAGDAPTTTTGAPLANGQNLTDIAAVSAPQQQAVSANGVTPQRIAAIDPNASNTSGKSGKTSTKTLEGAAPAANGKPGQIMPQAALNGAGKPDAAALSPQGNPLDLTGDNLDLDLSGNDLNTQMDADQNAALKTDGKAIEAALRTGVKSLPSSHMAAVISRVGEQFLQRFSGKTSTFEIRLDPPELGKVDVRVEVGKDGKIMAVIAARDPSVADALMRGAKTLENALTQAGLTLSEEGIQVELDQNNASGFAQSFADEFENSNSGYSHYKGDLLAEAVDDQNTLPTIESWSRHRLDLTA